jgi:hypothetical protein
MYNLLNKLQSFRICTICHLRKPTDNFISSSIQNLKEEISLICQTCRDALDDEESGGRGDNLSIDHSHKDAQKKKHQDDEDKKSASKEAYIDEMDKIHHEDLDQKSKAQQKRNDDLKDSKKDLSKKDANTDKKDGFSAEEAMTPALAEFAYDPDFHDPFKQRPTAEHHNIFATHPDRQDVKTLLTYVLSGHYSQLPAYIVARPDSANYTSAQQKTDYSFNQSKVSADTTKPSAFKDATKTAAVLALALTAHTAQAGRTIQQQAAIQSSQALYNQQINYQQGNIAAGGLGLLSLATLTNASYKPAAFMLPLRFQVNPGMGGKAGMVGAGMKAFFNRGAQPSTGPAATASQASNQFSSFAGGSGAPSASASSSNAAASSHFKATPEGANQRAKSAGEWSSFIKKVWK